MYKFGPVQQKILLLLVGGIALGLETSSIRYYRKLGMLMKDLKEIDARNLRRSMGRLCLQKLVEEVYLPDGSFKLVLTEAGKRQARIQLLFGKSIRFRNPKRWDKKWRIVMFDIPEKEKKFRDILREHLRELRFYKLQHSVFVSPYPCEKPLLELAALYKAGPYVRVVTAERIDNEEKLKDHFFRSKPVKSKKSLKSAKLSKRKNSSKNSVS